MTLHDHERLRRELTKATEPLRYHATLVKELERGLTSNLLGSSWVERSRTLALEKSSIAQAAAAISKSILPDFHRSVALANELSGALRQHKEFLRDVERMSQPWREMTAAVERIQKDLRPHLLDAQFARQLQLSTAASDVLRHTNLDSFVSAFGASSLHGDILRSLNGLAGSYRGWMEEAAGDAAQVMRRPLACSVFPAIEVFNEVDVLAGVETNDAGGTNDERDRIRQEITVDAQSARASLSDRGFGDLIPLLEGARDAVIRHGPDHVRHVATSLREAVTHVLHRLAPDDGISQWSKRKEDYANGKPTRRARLRFIYRGFDSEAFSEFVVKDVDAVLTLFDVFQQGTHGIDVSIAQRQLNCLVTRVESLVQFLISLDSEAR